MELEIIEKEDSIPTLSPFKSINRQPIQPIPRPPIQPIPQPIQPPQQLQERKKISYDDILSSMSMRLVNGKLELVN